MESGLKERASLTRAKSRYFLVVVCLLLGVLGTVHFQSRRNPSNIGAFQLIVPEDRLDFGDVWAQEAFPWTIPIHNPTADEVLIDELRPSCGCTSVVPESVRIPPGGTALIDVTLDLTYSRNDEDIAAEREFEVEITPTFASHIVEGTAWRLSGTVRRPFHLSPRVAEFKEGSLIAGKPFEAMVIEIVPFFPLERVQIDCDSVFASVSLLEPPGAGVAEALRPLKLRVAVSESLSPGRFQAAGTITGSTRAEGEFFPIPLLVSGKIVGRAQSYPSSLRLGARTQGDAATSSIELFSSNDESFSVQDVTTAIEGVEISPRSTGVGIRHLFDVRFCSDEPGQHDGDLHFVAVTEDGEHFTVDVPLSSYVVANSKGS